MKKKSPKDYGRWDATPIEVIKKPGTKKTAKTAKTVKTVKRGK